MLRKHRYDYAIRVWVLKRVKVSKKEIKYHVKVTQVLFSGKVKFLINKEAFIWSNSSSKCACPPKLRSGREYLLMGHEDRANRQLTITRHSVAGRWKDSWPNRIKRWRARLQSRGRGQRRRKKNRRRNRHREKRPGHGHREKKPNSTTMKNKRPNSTTINNKRPNSRRKSRPNKSAKKNFLRKSPWGDNPLPGAPIEGYTHGGRFYTKTKDRNHNRSSRD